MEKLILSNPKINGWYCADFSDADDENFDDPFDDDFGANNVEPWDGSSEPRDEQFETFSEYQDAHRDWRTSQAVQKGVSQALQQGQGDADELAPWKDDPQQADRSEGQSWLDHCRAEQKAASDRGDHAAARDWQDRGDLTQKELDALGPTPEEKYRDDAQIGFEDGTLDDQLFGPESERFDNERLQADASIVLARSNGRAETTLRLPLESDAWGAPLECRPRNMCKVELSPEQMADFNASVYQSGDSNAPQEVFQRSWAWLRQNGLAETATQDHLSGSSGSQPAPAADPAGRSEKMARIVEAGTEKHSDFEKVALNPKLPVSESMAAAIMGLDNAADVLYYLGNHADKAIEIHEMSDASQVQEAVNKLGRQVAGINPRSRIKDVSGASEPIKGIDSAASSTKDPEKMSQSEYEAWRMKSA